MKKFNIISISEFGALIFGLVLSLNIQAVTQVSTPERVTQIGANLDKDYDAEESAIAFNSQNNEYYIVFEATQSLAGSGAAVAVEVEIYAQRKNAITGVNIGSPARISQMGPELDAIYDARNPSVVYNATNNEYLVVWYGDTNIGTLEGEFEIWGKRINAANGQSIGSQFRISDMGPTANRSYDAIDPVVAYNSNNNSYLVVWRGEDGNLINAPGEFEIYAQQLSSTGSEIGTNDFRISDMGPNGDSLFDAYSPAIAYNDTSNEFLIVWYADDNNGGHVSGEFEIYGQRINAATGAEVGANDFQISETGIPGFITRSAQFPSVSWNHSLNEYLVVWSADPATGAYVGNEFEIFGQMLSSTGIAIGQDDFAISNVGPIGNNNFDAFRPTVQYFPAQNAYAVSWRGDTEFDGEFEIYYQIIAELTQARQESVDIRISHAGPDDSITYDARRASLISNPNNQTIQVIWEQEDETTSQTSGEFEIFSATISNRPDIIFKSGFE
ncbi:MAG: hypothetical protein L3J53_03345 [Proteobacteria bacterium]|nr:hypothetical protein [Pseudomonadota bacterium]